MRSATDFLPRVMSTLTNLATSALPYLGSGRISRLGTSLRRGICGSLSDWSGAAETLCRFRFLGAVLGAALLAILHALRVEAAAHDVVAHAGEVLDAAAADEHDRVLLQVVAFAADVADHLEAVGQAHLRHFPERGVGLLGRRRIDARAHAALLRRASKCRHFRLGTLSGASLPH